MATKAIKFLGTAVQAITGSAAIQRYQREDMEGLVVAAGKVNPSYITFCMTLAHDNYLGTPPSYSGYIEKLQLSRLLCDCDKCHASRPPKERKVSH